MANLIYNYFKRAVLQGSYVIGDSISPPIYVALLNNSYSPNIDTDIYVGQFLGTYEVSSAGYVAGGVALSGPNAQQDDTENQGILYGTSILWPSVTLTARGAVLYGSSGVGFSSDPLIAYIDFGADKTASAGTFQINWNASGILAIT